MNAGSAGRELRLVRHQIITPAKRDPEVTTIQGVRNPDDVTDTSGTTAHRLHLLQRKFVKVTEEEGLSEDMTHWHLMLENSQAAAEIKQLAFYIWEHWRLGHLTEFMAGSEIKYTAGK
jgi:hypothetical protein